MTAWFEFTYIPVVEKFVDPVSTFRGLPARETMNTLGGQQADVAGAGFAASGSALDLLRDSASQGALTHAVLGQQGLITEAGYNEQAASYKIMQGAANDAGNAENNAATAAEITGGIKMIAGLASVFTGGATGAAADVLTSASDSAGAVFDSSGNLTGAAADSSGNY